jgi:hypothetical protein
MLSIITGETYLAQRKAKLLGGNPLYPVGENGNAYSGGVGTSAEEAASI